MRFVNGLYSLQFANVHASRIDKIEFSLLWTESPQSFSKSSSAAGNPKLQFYSWSSTHWNSLESYRLERAAKASLTRTYWSPTDWNELLGDSSSDWDSQLENLRKLLSACWQRVVDLADSHRRQSSSGPELLEKFRKFCLGSSEFK